MKKLVKKILDFVFNTKHEKLILIGLPCLSILIAGIVLIPVFSSIISNNGRYSDNGASENDAVTNIQTTSSGLSSTEVINTPIPSSSAAPTEIDVPESTNIRTHLTATSTERDLYIFVRDDSNTPIPGKIFTIYVVYPRGQKGTYKSQDDGTCYLVNLSGGDYTVSMEAIEGYSTPDPIVCHVNERISYAPIENIDEIVDVTDETQIIDEVKTNESEAPQVTVAEVINTDTSGGTVPVYDQNGHQTYSYEWEEDDQGHLLDSNGNPTDVYPYYEEDGKLLWGFRLINNSTQEEVKLIYDDNTPVAGYKITATPLYKQSQGGWNSENGKVYYMLEDGSRAVGLKNIDGSMYYFDNSGVKASSVGIDVSFYNGTINWSTVKNSGIEYVIIRLGGRGWGTGVLYDDSCFYNYLNGAKAAGLKVGVYFYSTATNRVEAVQEASIVLDRLNGVPLELPVYIDMEYSGEYPNGRADKLTRAERVEVCTAFCETIKNSGYLPGLYASQSFLYEGLDYNSLSQYSIWMASYTENNRLPNTEYRYDMWQFSDRARIPGISGNCDINVIR